MDRNDFLTKELTGQGTFEKLCRAGVKNNYSPTFCGLQKRRDEIRELADAFDAEMERRGSSTRAHRCHWNNTN